jgi:3-phenylpropionate/trans-cinnamate dioxygenase ferredoxin subunit
MAETGTRHVVARVDEIPPGSRKIVEVAGRSIGVFNVDGRFHALRNRCPHQGGPLCEGFVFAALRSSGPGDYDHRPGEAFVRCPWHGWEFDIATGQSWFDPQRTRVRSYPVSVEPAAAGERVPGPYVAERYEVTVEDRCVVVDLGR